MMNNMDILIIVFIAIVGAAVLGLGLMFFGKKAWQRRTGFFITTLLGIYVASVSVRVLSVMFPLQYALGIAMGALSAVAFVLEISGKGKRKVNMLMGMVALIVGIINAFII